MFHPRTWTWKQVLYVHGVPAVSWHWLTLQWTYFWIPSPDQFQFAVISLSMITLPSRILRSKDPKNDMLLRICKLVESKHSFQSLSHKWLNQFMKENKVIPSTNDICRGGGGKQSILISTVDCRTMHVQLNQNFQVKM